MHSEVKNGTEGSVEFCAFYSDIEPKTGRLNDRVMQLHENSTFIKIDDYWLYSQGKHLPEIKLGRNDLCYCGSGNKIKKCPH